MYIYPYNKNWPLEFIKKSKKITDVSPIDIELHHIGSTSVPGLSSKNCIDILGVIKAYDAGHKLVQPLESIGFQYEGEYGIKRRHYFSRAGALKVHLHVFEENDENAKRHLHFSLVMQNRPDLVEEFNVIKEELQSKFSKEQYQRKKRYFYEKIFKIELSL